MYIQIGAITEQIESEFRLPGVTRLPSLWDAARFYRFRRPFGFSRNGRVAKKRDDVELFV